MAFLLHVIVALKAVLNSTCLCDAFSLADVCIFGLLLAAARIDKWPSA
jgi:hypothetical protein